MRGTWLPPEVRSSTMTYVPRPESMWRADATLRQFFAYIVSNTSMTLYTGVTNNLQRRVYEHKTGAGSKFTSRYHVDRLVYFETYDLIVDAIAREKQIKGMTRAKKIALIKTLNPTWRDLSNDFRQGVI